MSERSRVFITGISGFVGSHLARSLLKKGFEVHGVIRKTSDLQLLEHDIPRLSLHEASPTFESLAEILQKSQPEVVFHLAAHFKATHRPEDIRLLIDSNISFGTYLVEAMAATKVRNLVSTGTIWQNHGGSSYDPVSLYAATRQAFSDLLVYFTETDQVRAITLKLTDTYGPNDPRRKVFNLLVQALQTRQALDMTAGEQLVDIVHVDDVVRAYERAAEILREGSFKHRTRLVSSGSPISIRALARVLEEVSGSQLPVVWGKIPYRAREMFTSWASEPTLEGWAPRISLRDGIQSILGCSPDLP